MIDAGTHGVINWVDLSTPDVNAATDFYRDLFGWSVDKRATPMGEYFVASTPGREVVGMMAHGPEMKGAPAMWTTFIFVDDIDASAQQVSQSGGEVVVRPFQIPGDARVAVVADPTGAMFAIINGPRPDGLYFSGDHGSVCWSELLTRDPGAVETFYTAVFGWKPETHIARGTAYTMFKLDGDDIAGMMMMPDEVPAQAPAHWTVYFAVNDCAEIEKRAAALGGEVLVPTTTIQVGKFAVLADPQGAKFNLMEHSAR